MSQDTQKAMKDELIGARIEVIDSQNRDLIGIKGTIINETKNTIKVSVGYGERTLIKDQITFMINENIKINGKQMTYRPEDRIKRI